MCYTFEVEGRQLDGNLVRAALNRGDSFVFIDGKSFLFDSEAVNDMQSLFADCARTQAGAPPGFFRVSGIYAPYVKSAVEAFDAICLDDDGAPRWRETASARAQP